MPDYIDPFLRTDADIQQRLINFATGQSELLPDHKAWLDILLAKTPATREFYCDIYGYASKLGNSDSNQRLSYDRASAVAKYLEQRDRKYTSRIREFQSHGEEDPGYVAGQSDNDSRWRAVEVHTKFDRPPSIKGKIVVIPRNGMKWSVSGYFSLMTSVFQVAQFGVSLFKFKNDDTGEMKTFVSPMCGLGGGIDATKIFGWLKAIGSKKLPIWSQLEAVAEKVLKNPSLLANPLAVIKEIGQSIVTGAGLSDWTDFTKCEVYMPLSFKKLDGKTIANVSGTGSNYQIQKVYVYGQVWYTQKGGEKMFGTRDLLSAESAGWVAQVPALAAGMVGGPLLML